MRDSGLTCTAPNFAKSTSGTFGSAPTTGAARRREQPLHVGLDIILRDAALGPVPLIRPKSAPSSRANLRTEGLA